MDIVLDGPEEFVHSYSTFDEIKGNVVFKFDKDTTIDDIHVTFEGITQTYVEKVASTAPTTGRTTGKHHFLKLLQPVEPEELPEDRMAKAGETYTIPFAFTVPERLLPSICSHTTENGEVTRAHVQLPPSLGDANIAGDGLTFYDDLAPDMSKITYCVRVRLAKRQPTARNVEVVDKAVKVRIVPGKDEEPPIHVQEGEADYLLRKEKSVRRGFLRFGNKIGRLVAETSQPRSLRLPHVANRSPDPITTSTSVNLRFDPLDPAAQPPQLSSVTTKLRAYTFFGAAPYRSIPEVSAKDNWSSLHGLYPEYIELSSRNLSTVTWTRHDPNERTSEITRRPSTFSDCSLNSVPEPSAGYVEGSPFWTTSLLVPIVLPTESRKIFVPSFHSCMVSRSYTLELNISFHPPGAAVGFSPSIVLKSPVQISSEGGIPPAGLEESEAALAEEIERQFYEFDSRQFQDAQNAVNVSEPLPADTSSSISSTTEQAGPPSLQSSSPTYSQAQAQSVLPEVPEYTEEPVEHDYVGRSQRQSSHMPTVRPTPPPEYSSGAGGRVRGGGSGPRTQSVSSTPQNRIPWQASSRSLVRWRRRKEVHLSHIFCLRLQCRNTPSSGIADPAYHSPTASLAFVLGPPPPPLPVPVPHPPSAVACHG